MGARIGQAAQTLCTVSHRVVHHSLGASVSRLQLKRRPISLILRPVKGFPRMGVAPLRTKLKLHRTNPRGTDARLGCDSQCIREPMNTDKLQGQWKQPAGRLKGKWGKHSDDDLTVTDGTTEHLEGKFQERYGIARDEAKRQVRNFSSRL
jgi:uncharacterized protein YjbJ (UPF0337 family)